MSAARFQEDTFCLCCDRRYSREVFDRLVEHRWRAELTAPQRAAVWHLQWDVHALPPSTGSAKLSFATLREVVLFLPLDVRALCAARAVNRAWCAVVNFAPHWMMLLPTRPATPEIVAQMRWDRGEGSGAARVFTRVEFERRVPKPTPKQQARRERFLLFGIRRHEDDEDDVDKSRKRPGSDDDAANDPTMAPDYEGLPRNYDRLKIGRLVPLPGGEAAPAAAAAAAASSGETGGAESVSETHYLIVPTTTAKHVASEVCRRCKTKMRLCFCRGIHNCFCDTFDGRERGLCDDGDPGNCDDSCSCSSSADDTEISTVRERKRHAFIAAADRAATLRLHRAYRRVRRQERREQQQQPEGGKRKRREEHTEEDLDALEHVAAMDRAFGRKLVMRTEAGDTVDWDALLQQSKRERAKQQKLEQQQQQQQQSQSHSRLSLRAFLHRHDAADDHETGDDVKRGLLHPTSDAAAPASASAAASSSVAPRYGAADVEMHRDDDDGDDETDKGEEAAPNNDRDESDSTSSSSSDRAGSNRARRAEDPISRHWHTLHGVAVVTPRKIWSSVTLLQKLIPPSLADVPIRASCRTLLVRRTFRRVFAPKSETDFELRRHLLYPTFSAFSSAVRSNIRAYRKHGDVSFLDMHGLAALFLVAMWLLVAGTCVAFSYLLGRYFFELSAAVENESPFVRSFFTLTDAGVERYAAMFCGLVLFGPFLTPWLAAKMFGGAFPNWRDITVAKLAAAFGLVLMVVSMAPIVALVESRVQSAQRLLDGGVVDARDAFIAAPSSNAHTTDGGDECSVFKARVRRAAQSTFVHFPPGTIFLHHPRAFSENHTTVPVAAASSSSASCASNTSGGLVFNASVPAATQEEIRDLVTRGRVNWYSVWLPMQQQRRESGAATTAPLLYHNATTVLIAGDYDDAPFWSRDCNLHLNWTQGGEHGAHDANGTGAVLWPHFDAMADIFAPVMENVTDIDHVLGNASLVSPLLAAALAARQLGVGVNSNASILSLPPCRFANNSMAVLRRPPFAPWVPLNAYNESRPDASFVHDFHLRVAAGGYAPHWPSSVDGAVYDHAAGPDGPQRGWQQQRAFTVFGVVPLMADSSVFLARRSQLEQDDKETGYPRQISPWTAEFAEWNEAVRAARDWNATQPPPPLVVAPFWSAAHPDGLRALYDDYASGTKGLLIFFAVCAAATMLMQFTRGLVRSLYFLLSGICATVTVLWPLVSLIVAGSCLGVAHEEHVALVSNWRELALPNSCLMARTQDMIGPLVWCAVLTGLPLLFVGFTLLREILNGECQYDLDCLDRPCSWLGERLAGMFKFYDACCSCCDASTEGGTPAGGPSSSAVPMPKRLGSDSDTDSS